MKRPKHLDAAGHLSPRRPIPEPEPVKQGRAARRRRGEARSRPATATGRRRASRSISRSSSSPGGRLSKVVRAARRCRPCPTSSSHHRADDRHVDVALQRDAMKHRRGVRAFGDRPAVLHQLGDLAAFADRLAEREIAAAGRRAGQHQVAKARQAGQSLAPSAHRDPEARHFGEAARDQRRARVLAEALALDDAAGDRQHVLDRPADLGAGDIVGAVSAEIRAD